MFDLDGTLADTREDIAASVNEALRRLGRPPRDVAEIKGFIGDGFRSLMKRALGAEDEALADRALEIFSPHYLAHCADRSALYPGVSATLERLSGRALAVVTNKPEAHSRAILKALGLEKFFPVVLGGDSLPVRKPDPGPLREALRRLGVPAEAALMVGDSANDIRAAKAAGVSVCAVTYGYRPREELAGADMILDRIEDLAETVGG
ncbi:MAG: phosphoglycolate phosphatase [Elusimicrobiota bacterium]